MRKAIRAYAFMFVVGVTLCICTDALSQERQVYRDFWDWQDRNGYSFVSVEEDYLVDSGFYSSPTRHPSPFLEVNHVSFFLAFNWWKQYRLLTQWFRRRLEPTLTLSGGLGLRVYLDSVGKSFNVLGEEVEIPRVDFDSAMFVNSFVALSFWHITTAARCAMEWDEWRCALSFGARW